MDEVIRISFNLLCSPSLKPGTLFCHSHTRKGFWELFFKNTNKEVMLLTWKLVLNIEISSEFNPNTVHWLIKIVNLTEFGITMAISQGSVCGGLSGLGWPRQEAPLWLGCTHMGCSLRLDKKEDMSWAPAPISWVSQVWERDQLPQAPTRVLLDELWAKINPSFLKLILTNILSE